MKRADPPYWFLLRRSGGGWGPPVTWQGRVLFLGLLVPLALALTYGLWLPETPAALARALTLILGVAVFLVVALRHSEPPRSHRR